MTGYRCGACGNGEVFGALKPYWHKVEIDAGGMVLEAHGIHSDGEVLEKVECSRCGAACASYEPPAKGSSSYRCLTCGNDNEFHRFYVEEARERLDENGYWEIVEAWEFADGAETTFGAICTPCDTAGRAGEVEEIGSAVNEQLERKIEEE